MTPHALGATLTCGSFESDSSMSSPPNSNRPRQLVFGPFVFDETFGELRKHGIRVRLEGKPLQLLAAVIRKPGQAITRDELQNELWESGTFVDFDHGLNAAMNRLRGVLGDSADQPRYIETLPGRGYRFIAAVQETVPKPVLMMAPTPVAGDLEPAALVPPAIQEQRIVVEDNLPAATTNGPSASTVGSRGAVLAWAVAASVLATVAGVGWWSAWRSTGPVDHPLLRLNVDLGPDAVADNHITAAFSPDGSRLLFHARGPDGTQQLAVRLLDRPQATLLSGTEGAFAPFFSPDGQWIGFFAEGKMKKVSVFGGGVVTLCDAPDARGAAWGEDGNIIATLNSMPATGLSRIPAAGGMPQALTHPGEIGEATHRWPQILPGSQAVLFTGNKTASNYDDSSLEILSLRTGQVKMVLRGGYFGRYVQGGYLVYIHHGALFGIRFDLDRQEVRGTPAFLQEDIAGNPTTAGGQFDLSHNGNLVYLSGKSPSGTWTLVWLDSAGHTQPLRAAPGIYYNPRLSPDGQRIAYSTNSAIEVYDWGRDSITRLTFTAQTQTNLKPVWTPDGKHIIFVSQGTNEFSLQWIRADGSGEAQLLLKSKNELVPRSFSPDGKRLAFEERDAETRMDIWTLPIDLSDPEHPRPGKAELFLRTPFAVTEPAFSPDGRWMAYSSAESGGPEVFVRPFAPGVPSGSGKWLISTGGGQSPIWSRIGKELFYKGPGNRIMTAAYTANGDSFAAGKPRPWSNSQILGELDLEPDGKRFVGTFYPPTGSSGEPNGSVHVTFLLNFFDEVRRRIRP